MIYFIKLVSIRQQWFGTKIYSSFKNAGHGFDFKHFPNDLFIVNSQNILTITLNLFLLYCSLRRILLVITQIGITFP